MMTFGIAFFARLMRLPLLILPMVIVFSVLGAFALNNRVFDIWVMIGFGTLGILLELAKVPLAPSWSGRWALVAESELRNGLMASAGSFAPLAERPIALTVLIISAGLFVWPLSRMAPRRRIVCKSRAAPGQQGRKIMISITVVALTGIAAGAVLPAIGGLGHAAAYPEKPIRTIVPIAPGGQTDAPARLVQLTIDKAKLLPQPMVIINNAAAGGSAGTRLVRDAEPDGYTIGMFHMGLLIPAMGVVDYDHTAFEMIGQVGRTPIGLGVDHRQPLQDHPGPGRGGQGQARHHHGGDEYRPAPAFRRRCSSSMPASGCATSRPAAAPCG